LASERELTFGEHLDELRAHVIRAIVYLSLALLICLIFQESLMRLVLWPQHHAIDTEDHADRMSTAAVDLEAVLASVRAGAFERGTPQERRALGARFARVFAAIAREPDARLGFLAPQEAFFAYMKVAFICALFLASPFVATELWKFIAEGLHAHEARWVRVFGPVSYVCFAGGALFGYFTLIPSSLEYLETYGSRDLVVPMITLDAYLDLFLGLTLAVGLAFEVPVIMVFLSLIGIVDGAQLAGFRRYYIFVATVAAAAITPTGDPLTMSLVGVPLLLLYELGITLVRFIERRNLMA
jgi:sec-independent protein translocase protein TatC